MYYEFFRKHTVSNVFSEFRCPVGHRADPRGPPSAVSRPGSRQGFLPLTWSAERKSGLEGQLSTPPPPLSCLQVVFIFP